MAPRPAPRVGRLTPSVRERPAAPPADEAAVEEARFLAAAALAYNSGSLEGDRALRELLRRGDAAVDAGEANLFEAE